MEPGNGDVLRDLAWQWVPILLSTWQKPLMVGWGKGSSWSMVSSAVRVPATAEQPRCDQHTPHVVLCQEEPGQGEAKGPSSEFTLLWVNVDDPQLPGWDLCSWLQKEWQWEGQFPARGTSYSQAEGVEARQTHFYLGSTSGSFCWLLPDPWRSWVHLLNKGKITHFKRDRNQETIYKFAFCFLYIWYDNVVWKTVLVTCVPC